MEESSPSPIKHKAHTRLISLSCQTPSDSILKEDLKNHQPAGEPPRPWETLWTGEVPEDGSSVKESHGINTSPNCIPFHFRRNQSESNMSGTNYYLAALTDGPPLMWFRAGWSTGAPPHHQYRSELPNWRCRLGRDPRRRRRCPKLLQGTGHEQLSENSHTLHIAQMDLQREDIKKQGDSVNVSEGPMNTEISQINKHILLTPSLLHSTKLLRGKCSTMLKYFTP